MHHKELGTVAGMQRAACVITALTITTPTSPVISPFKNLFDQGKEPVILRQAGRVGGRRQSPWPCWERIKGSRVPGLGMSQARGGGLAGLTQCTLTFTEHLLARLCARREMGINRT